MWWRSSGRFTGPREKSPVVKALQAAREAGKNVTVMIEVMARFDELANLDWAKQLEECGVHVVYGLTQLDLKTHAKLGQVVRRENGELRTYCHIGTGNYHPATAKVYTDLSYFTADPAVGRDVSKIFNYVTTYSRPNDLERMYISPHGIKARIIEEIHKRNCPPQGGPPGRYLDEAQRACGYRCDRCALRGEPLRRAGRSRHPRHMLPQARNTGLIGKHPRQKHRRTVLRA